MTKGGEGIILLVDDRQDNLTMMTIFLEVWMKELENVVGQKLKIVTAQSGSQALEIIEANKQEIRFVATDYNMPELNGAELIFYIIEHLWTDNMAFTIITNLSGRGTERDAHCIPGVPDSMTDVIPVGGKGSAGYALLADHLADAWKRRHKIRDWYQQNVINLEPKSGSEGPD